MINYTWESVVRECEDILQVNYHARTPLESNLPNIIRDMIYKLTVLPTASYQADPADPIPLCPFCEKPMTQVFKCFKCNPTTWSGIR